MIKITQSAVSRLMAVYIRGRVSIDTSGVHVFHPTAFYHSRRISGYGSFSFFFFILLIFLIVSFIISILCILLYLYLLYSIVTARTRATRPSPLLHFSFSSPTSLPLLSLFLSFSHLFFFSPSSSFLSYPYPFYTVYTLFFSFSSSSILIHLTSPSPSSLQRLFSALSTDLLPTFTSRCHPGIRITCAGLFFFLDNPSPPHVIAHRAPFFRPPTARHSIWFASFVDCASS